MLDFRFATANDVELYYKWANDAVVRQNSINTKPINHDDHIKWYVGKVNNPQVLMYVFLNETNTPVGQVIIEQKDGWASVGQSVAVEHRGKKYSTEMLTKATDDFLSKYPDETIISVVKASNIASLKMSEKSGFNVLILNEKHENNLVLKGCKQHDEIYIERAKRILNL